MEFRSFLAFELKEEIKETISKITNEIKPLLPDIRWTRPENIHLTVVFMGNIDESYVDVIDRSARNICRGYEPFNIFLNGIGIFGTRRNPRVIWIGLGGDIKKMAALRDDLSKSLKPLGIRQEKRPFKPHLTIGRFKKQPAGPYNFNRILHRYKHLHTSEHTQKILTMYKSELRQRGAVYTKIRSWPLGMQDKLTEPLP